MFIKRIYLDDNQIKTIEGLNKCKNLIKPDLGYNAITCIPGGVFEDLVNLERLFLFNNQIKTIRNVDHLINLTYLSLGSNKIEEIPIGALDKLVKL